MKNKTPQEWSGKSRGGSLGYLFFIYTLRFAGIGACYFFLSLVVVYFIPFAPRATVAIWHYNRRILNQKAIPAALGIYAHYYRFGQVLIDKIAIGAGMEKKYRFEFEGYDEFLRLLDSGEGAVVIGAHVGAWETGAAFFGDYARRLNIVMFDAEYERIKDTLQAHTDATGIKVIPINEGSIEGVLRIKHALDAGDAVCFQGDRYVDPSSTLTMDFMGREARFPTGPFTVACKMRKPVVFYYAMREKGRKYRFEFTVTAPGQVTPTGHLASAKTGQSAPGTSRHSTSTDGQDSSPVGHKLSDPSEPDRSASRSAEQKESTLLESGRSFPAGRSTTAEAGQPITAERRGDITTEQLAQAYCASLEDVVRRYPRQWFNFYKFWS